MVTEIKKERLCFAIFKIATFFSVIILVFILLYVFFKGFKVSISMINIARRMPGLLV